MRVLFRRSRIWPTGLGVIVWKKVINLLVGIGIAIILTLAGLLIYGRVVVVPRSQLIGQSIALHATALDAYIDEFAMMPGSYDDLERAGILRRVDAEELQRYDDYRSTGKFQMTMPCDTHYLYHSDEIAINWSADVDQIEVKNGRLFDKSTGNPTYLLCSRGCMRGGLFAVCYNSSLSLYYDLLKARRDASN